MPTEKIYNMFKGEHFPQKQSRYDVEVRQTRQGRNR